MTKVTIRKQGEEEIATATVDFELGKVYRTKKSEDGKTQTIIAGMGIDGMVNYYKQLLFERGQSKDWKSFEDALEQYVTLRVNQMIGIKFSPLKFNDEGVLEGLDEFVEVVIEKE